ncbi:MAG: cbb3-type cytochrome c oxidase subunit 3 [Proteobacteria bacterium]|nr:cbb3-type cytochrome c oxidase subunit 3 [Pseudomonadota bacterium]
MDPTEFAAWVRPFMTAWVFAVFLGILGWVYWPRRRAVYDDAASIPLREDR